MKHLRLAPLLILATACSMVLLSSFVNAQTFPSPYQLAEPLPGSTSREISSLEQYLTIAYVSLLSAALGFGLVMLVYSGVQYITAGGNQSAAGAAKSRMTRVAYGFLIIIGAVLILTTLGGNSFLKLNLKIDPIKTPGTGSSGTNDGGAGQTP